MGPASLKRGLSLRKSLPRQRVANSPTLEFALTAHTRCSAPKSLSLLSLPRSPPCCGGGDISKPASDADMPFAMLPWVPMLTRKTPCQHDVYLAWVSACQQLNIGVVCQHGPSRVSRQHARRASMAWRPWGHAPTRGPRCAGIQGVCLQHGPRRVTTDGMSTRAGVCHYN